MYLRYDDANPATHDDKEAAMSIIPTRVHEQVSRVDRTRSLYIGIAAGITALWSLYRVFWLFYAAATLSSVGYTGVSLAFPLVLWGAVTILAGAVAAVFLLRYSKQP
jgi:predicted peptidase